MLVTLLLSWLLAAEPACRSACAANAPRATAHHCPSTACDQDATAVRGDEPPEILSFEAAWCAPCQEMRSALSRLKQSGVRVRYIDVDREPELARRYRVTSIPAFISIANGREAARATGVCSYNELTRLAGAAGMRPGTMNAAAALAPGATRAEILVRATYELEPERAKALPTLLETFGIDEVRQDGGHANKYAVTITTAPAAQRAIGQFLSVLGGSTSKTTAAATHHDSPKGQAIGEFEECSGREESRKIAERYLGSQAWTSDDDCRVLRIDRTMIFFKDWEARGDGTAFRFRPFAMITWQKGGREQDPVRFASDSAVLRFQSPYHLQNPQHGELIGGSLEGDVRIYGNRGTVKARAHDFHFSEDQLQSRSGVQSDSASACGPGCTNECGGECTTSCEDGVPRGAAVPDAPGVPLVPPVWMSTAALPPNVMPGKGIDEDSGVCSAVVLDELTPVLKRLTRYRVFEGAGPFYTMVLTADRGLISDVREFVETKTRESAEQGGKRLLFGASSAEPGREHERSGARRRD